MRRVKPCSPIFRPIQKVPAAPITDPAVARSAYIQNKSGSSRQDDDGEIDAERQEEDQGRVERARRIRPGGVRKCLRSAVSSARIGTQCRSGCQRSKHEAALGVRSNNGCDDQGCSWSWSLALLVAVIQSSPAAQHRGRYRSARWTGLPCAYVKLALAMGLHDSDYVDAFYGPANGSARSSRRSRRSRGLLPMPPPCSRS